jgi:hypothetical protein
VAHYKSLLDPGVFVGPADFPKEREVTISRVVREEIPARPGEEKQSSPMLYFLGKNGVEYPRKLKVPKSVLFGLSLLLGTETDAWVGKKIAVFSAWCLSFGEREECLRVRFPAQIENDIRKWLKKRKASPSCYMIDGPAPSSAPAKAADKPAPATGAYPEAEQLLHMVESRDKERAAAIRAVAKDDPAKVLAACKDWLDAEGIEYGAGNA